MSEVSIIVRSKNEAKWIGETLSRIRSQTISSEIIIVDNESTDETVSIAKKFQPDHIISINNFLPGKAINLGLTKATTNYVICLSAHCLPIGKDWIKKLIEALEFKDEKRATNIVAAYGRQLPLRSTSDLNKRDLYNTFGLENRIQFTDFFFHNANSIIKRDYLIEHPFSESITNVEDRVWANEVINSGFQISYSAEASVYHHHGLNHGNEPSRLKRVNSIIEPLYKDSHKNSSLEKIEIIKPNYAKFSLIYMSLEHIDVVKLNNLTAELSDLNGFSKSYFILPNKPESAANDKKSHFYSRSLFPNLSNQGLFQFLKFFYESYIESNDDINYLLFLSEKGLENIDRLKLLWDYTNENFLDFAFTGKQISKNLWVRRSDYLEPVYSDIYLKEFSDPIYDVKYGHGLFISNGQIKSNNFYDGVNGLYEY